METIKVEKTILTFDNGLFQTDRNRWIATWRQLDMTKWDASIIHRQNGNHIYVIKRKSQMVTAPPPPEPEPSDIAVKVIIFCLAITALAFIIGKIFG